MSIRDDSAAIISAHKNVYREHGPHPTKALAAMRKVGDRLDEHRKQFRAAMSARSTTRRLRHRHRLDVAHTVDMKYLHHGGGASIRELGGPVISDEEWLKMRAAACRLLRARRHEAAAALLERMPFELVDGTNVFGDEFSVLRAVVAVEQYVALEEAQLSKTIEQPFKVIAETLTEISQKRPYVRFVVAQLETDGDVLQVPAPSPKITSESIDSALADAELFARSRGPANAVDRVHPAVHGYLRAALERAGASPAPLASVTELFKQLRESDERLRDMVVGGDETKRIVMGLASIVDAANTIRNTASAAHPSGEKLEYAEAMLVINAARSLLHYLDAKLNRS